MVAGPRAALATATARLDLVESLGNETFIYARAGKHDITARVSPQSLPPIGSKIVLAFNLEKAHFFDAISGDRIGYADARKLRGCFGSAPCAERAPLGA